MVQKNLEDLFWQFPKVILEDETIETFKNKFKNSKATPEECKKEYELLENRTRFISTQRNYANTLFVAVISIITGAFFLNEHMDMQIICLIFSIILFLYWRNLICAYQKRNSLYFIGILEIEKESPFVFYTAEWEVIKRDKKYK